MENDLLKNKEEALSWKKNPGCIDYSIGRPNAGYVTGKEINVQMHSSTVISRVSNMAPCFMMSPHSRKT